MHVPKGFEVEGASKGEYVFWLNKNLYRQKEAGCVWNKYLVKGLTKLGFKQSEVDKCIFYKENMIYILYPDKLILVGPDQQKIQKTIAQMKQKFYMTEEGNLSNFLGITYNTKTTHI